MLLKAFDTPTGIPYGTINLADGGSVPPKETTITSLATAGTFSIEFGVLSRLTGDSKYEEAAFRAVEAVWSFKSPMNLVGNHINIVNGAWTSGDASIGGNCDSFYEYLLKAGILFGHQRSFEIFEASYRAVRQHMFYAPWYFTVNMNNGHVTGSTFESLQAFWPGLQVLYGDLDDASLTMHAFQQVWRSYGFVPEAVALNTQKISAGRAQYPLRPEMAESLYYLYTATKDPIWLQYGREILDSIESVAKVECGIAAVENVKTGELRDHMDSFFLSETCKYLYLLFTPDHPITTEGYIFNTEGHPFPIRYDWMENGVDTVAPGKCQVPSLLSSLSYDSFQPLYHRTEKQKDIIQRNTLQSTSSITPQVTPKPPAPVEEAPSLMEEPSVRSNDLEGYAVLIIDDTDFGGEEFASDDIFHAVLLAQFGLSVIPEGGISGPLRVATPYDACEELQTTYDDQPILLVQRGTCDFVQKVQRAQSAGAVGVIVVNNVPSEETNSVSMSGTSDEVTVPSALVSSSLGERLLHYAKLESEDRLFVTFSQDIGKEELSEMIGGAEPIFLDIEAILDESNEASEHLSAIVESLGVEDSEGIVKQLRQVLQQLSEHGNSEMIQLMLDVDSQGVRLHAKRDATILEEEDRDEDDLSHDEDMLSPVDVSYTDPGKVIGKQYRACVDGQC